MPRPCVPAVLLALATAATPLPLQAAPPGSSLEQELREVTLALQRVWQRDPVSSGRPFPAVRLEAAIDPRTCPAAPFPVSRALLLACPALRYLNLTDCRKLTEGAVRAMVQHGGALRHVDLGGCASVSAAGERPQPLSALTARVAGS